MGPKALLGDQPLAVKNTTPSFLSSFPLNWQTAQAPQFFRQLLPPLYWFFVKNLLKVKLFSEFPKYWIFSCLTPSYLLKITKFLVKMSHFKFLVMREKNIFDYYEPFLSLNISDFNLFFMWKLQPLEESHPLFPSIPL